MNKESSGIMYRKNQISKIELFSNCKKESIEKLLEVSKIIEIDKGKVLMHIREEITCVYIQLSGKSFAYNFTNHGKRKILFVFGKGSLLNTDVFNYRTSSMIYETIETSTLLCIPSKALEKTLQNDYVLAKNIMIAQEKKLNRLSRQLKNTASGISVEKKLLSKLWKLSKDFGVKTKEGIEIDMNLSITFLADMLGIPRESASRACSRLVKEKLIKINEKRITIINPEKLAQMYKAERKNRTSKILQY